MKPTIGITIGDFNGVGPEVALRSASHAAIKKICTPVLIGPLNVFEHSAKLLKIKVKLEKSRLPVLPSRMTPVIDVGDGIWADVEFGAVSKAAGRSAGVAIEHAVEHAVAGNFDAIVTAPVSKESLNLAGYNFPGQTEMLALLSRSSHVAMMLVSDSMRIGLISTHQSLRSVAESLSTKRIVEKGTIFHEALRKFFGIPEPRLAMLGLNPHAGEKGLLGDEEQSIIAPAIEQLKEHDINVEGPFPADGFFGSKAYAQYDTIVAMYHDQGLIPLKMNSFKKSVNYSAGLTIIRTSPGHGTAYDLAGKGKADISSMIEAVKLATRFAERRR